MYASTCADPSSDGGGESGDPSHEELIVITLADGQNLWPIQESFLRSFTSHIYGWPVVDFSIRIEWQGWPLPPARKLTRKILITGILHYISVAQSGCEHLVMATAVRRLGFKGQEHPFHYCVVLSEKYAMAHK